MCAGGWVCFVCSFDACGEVWQFCASDFMSDEFTRVSRYSFFINISV